MTSTYIRVAEAKAENLVAPNPPKDYTLPPPKTEKYTRTYFQYNFGTPEKAFLSEPIFELTKTKANIKKTEKDGKFIWKLNLTLRDEDDIRGCAQLDKGIGQCVFKYKGQFKQYTFNPENPGGLRGTFFYSRTPEGEIIDGTAPIMSLKFDDKSIFHKLNFMFDENGAAIVDQTTGLPKYTEEPVDYKKLENMSFECGLTFSLRDLYQSGGTMPSPQLFVRTCWILSAPSQRGAVDSKQSSVLRNFLQGASAEDLTTLMAVVDQLKSGQGASLLETLKTGGGTGVPQGLPGLPPPQETAGDARPAQPSSYPQLPPAPSVGGQKSSGSPTPTIDLTTYMNPQQQQPQAPQPSQPYPPQTPQGYPQQYPADFTQYLQSGMVGQPQPSVTRM